MTRLLRSVESSQVIQGARNDGFESARTQILAAIRRPFAALHQGNDIPGSDSSPPSNPSDDLDNILGLPSSYPPCTGNALGHHPDSATHGPATVVPTMPSLTQPRGLPKAEPHPASTSQPSLSVPPAAANEDVTPGNPDIPIISFNANPIHGSSDDSMTLLRNQPKKIERSSILLALVHYRHYRPRPSTATQFPSCFRRP